MNKFVFTIANGRTTVEADGSLEELAQAVGILAHTIHAAYLNNDPGAAAYFKILVKAQFSADQSPVWNPHKKEEGDIEIVKNTYEEENHASQS